MSSGSYFPPPVKAMEIPKSHSGGVGTLGVPPVGDRIAQTVVARRVEARVEPIFHPDSYGYRPNRSALDAVAACRQRCICYGWVMDLDVRKFFDSVAHDLIIKAVRRVPAAISKDALNKISQAVRSWRLQRRIGHTFAELARAINPIVRGWMQYYGAFYRSALHPLLQRINAYLMRWIRKKYKRLRRFKKARTCWEGITTRYSRLFAHWRWTRGFWAPGVTRAG
jgi:retron-type reverse transcriptase